MKTYNIPMLAAIALVTACSDSSDHTVTEVPPAPIPMVDFSAVDARLEDFVAENEHFDGASIVIVDKNEGTIHRTAFGDHTVDTVVLLASTSKVPAVSLLMALAEDDDNVDFEIDGPISDYLPWVGVWSTDINRTPGFQSFRHSRSGCRVYRAVRRAYLSVYADRHTL